MYIGQNKIRQDLAEETRQLIAVEWARPELKAAAQAWLDTMEDGEANAEPAKAFVKALEDSICTVDELAAVPQFAEHAAELKAKGALFCDCQSLSTIAADLLSKKEYLPRSPCGSSAATAGPTTSATAVWTTSSPPSRM